MAKAMLLKRLAALSNKIVKTKSTLAQKVKSPFQRGILQREVGKNTYKNISLPSKFDTKVLKTEQHIKKYRKHYAAGAVGGAAVMGGLKYQKVRRTRSKI